MRFLSIATCALVLVALAFLELRMMHKFEPFSPPSAEIVQLTAENRAHLQRLRAEVKFQANDYPPLGYTGAPNPEDHAQATAAVNTLIDGILARFDGPVSGREVSALIGKAIEDVDLLETEDRERAYGYTLEVWYILGFKGPTGHFGVGSAYPRPEGYSEALPPGWLAPDQPRRIID
jgi:hypothetical protein